jgi:dTDP-4-amino-4,6-dideoxygalactose transaminase
MAESSLIPINNLRQSWALQSDEVVLALNKVLKSGHWIHGEEHAAFESELASFLGSKHLFGVASGTDALEIALRAVGCERHSKVITVANAGGYTPVAAASIGCEIIYCDVDPTKLLMDPETLVGLLSEKIAAVVVTHLYGNVAPAKRIRELCEPFGIKVIEDCAQAIGATEFGDSVGTIGHVGTFSFYPTKNLGAIGDGGALATDDSEIAQRITELRQYGWTSKYKIDRPGGMNSRLDEIQAAVLRIGLPKLESLNQLRRQIVEQYSKALEGSDIRLVTSFQPGNVAHLAVIELPERFTRSSFREYMGRCGIQTGIHYPILDSDQIGLAFGKNKNLLPNSISSVGRIVSIPLFPELTDHEINTICTTLRNFLN